MRLKKRLIGHFLRCKVRFFLNFGCFVNRFKGLLMHMMISGLKGVINYGSLVIMSESFRHWPAPKLRWELIKENKKVRKQENKNSTKKATKKKRKKFLFFLITFLVEFLFSFFFFCFLVFLFAYFLVFFYQFPPQVRERTCVWLSLSRI